MNITFQKNLNIIFVLFISIFLIFSSVFVFPFSFALAEDFPNVPLYSSFDRQYLYEYENYNNKQYYIGSPNSSDVYLAVVKTADHATDDNQDSFGLYAFSTDSSAIIRTLRYSILQGTNLYDEQSLTFLSDNYYGVQIDGQMRSLISRYNADIPVFESFDELFGDFDSTSGQLYSFPQFPDSTSINYNHIESNGVWVYSGYNIYSLEGTYSSSSSPDSQYGYYVDGDSTYCVVFSSVPLTVYKAFVNGETYSYSVCSQYDEGKYYYVFPEPIENEIQDSFASLVDAQSAFAGASSDGSGGGFASGVVSAGAIDIDVPAGNVLYIKPRAGSIAMLHVEFPVLSSSSSPYWTSRNSTAMWLSGVPSLPSANTTFPLSGMSDIVWSKDEDKVDGYGRSYFGHCSHAPFNSGWFVVYNPTYTRAVTDDYIGQNPATYNPTITVSMQYATEYYIYDLNEAITPTGNSSSSNTDYNSSWGGNYNSNTNQWDKTNTNVDSDSPVSGGQNSASAGASLSITDYIQNLHNTISNFVNNLLSLLTAPIEHIGNLVSHATSFFNVLVSMFSWLPEEVLSVITSALVVIFVIGAIKIFSR